MRGLLIGGTPSGDVKIVAALAAVQPGEDLGFSVPSTKAGPVFFDPSHQIV